MMTFDLPQGHHESTHLYMGLKVSTKPPAVTMNMYPLDFMLRDLYAPVSLLHGSSSTGRLLFSHSLRIACTSPVCELTKSAPIIE